MTLVGTTLVEMTSVVISLVSLCRNQPHIRLIASHITHLQLSLLYNVNVNRIMPMDVFGLMLVDYQITSA